MDPIPVRIRRGYSIKNEEKLNIYTKNHFVMKKILPLLLIFLVIFSCKKPNNDLTFQSVINDGGVFDDPINTTTRTVTIDTVLNGDSLWACTTETYNVTKGMQEFPLFPNEDMPDEHIC